MDHRREQVREEDDERVKDSLRDAHRHHVAVCDMRDFVAKDAAKFLARHLAHDVGRDCYKRGVLERTSGERVCRARVDCDLWRLDVRTACEVFNGSDEPALRLALGAVYRAALHRHLDDSFRQQQRNYRARHAEDEREHQKRRIAALSKFCGEVNAQEPTDNRSNDSQRRDRRDIDDKEHEYPFHADNYTIFNAQAQSAQRRNSDGWQKASVTTSAKASRTPTALHVFHVEAFRQDLQD